MQECLSLKKKNILHMFSNQACVKGKLGLKNKTVTTIKQDRNTIMSLYLRTEVVPVF